MPVSPHRPALAETRVMHVGEPVAMVVASNRGAGAGRRRTGRRRLRGNDAGHRRARGASKPARRSCGPKRPAMSATTGPRPPIPTERNRPRSSAPSRTPLTSSRSNSSTSVWSWLRSNRASPPPATTQQTKRYTLRCPTQGFASVRMQVAGAMNIKPEELHIQTEDVGGAFGMKGWVYPEYVAMLHGARVHRQTDPLGLDPLGSFRHRQPGPRLILDRRTGAQQARPIPRPQGRLHRQSSAPISPASRISSSPCMSPAACRRSMTFRMRR